MPPPRLSAFPLAASAKDYERAADEIDSALTGLPGLVALYGTGRVSTPGISDIDRIVVVERGSPRVAVWQRLSKRTRELAMHTPFLVDVDTFRMHRWFAFLDPLELRWGDPVVIEDSPLLREADLVLGLEGMVLLALKLVRQASVGRIKVRAALCELHGLHHSLRLAGVGEDEAPRASRVTSAVAELRRNWFEASSREASRRLVQVIEDAWPALIEAMDAVAGGTPAPRELRLTGPWSHVVLVPGDAPKYLGSGSRDRAVRWLSRSSARLSHRVWQLRRQTLPLPGAALGRLEASPGGEGQRFRARRVELLRRYAAFLDGSSSHYSAIGLAPQFLWP